MKYQSFRSKQFFEAGLAVYSDKHLKISQQI